MYRQHKVELGGVSRLAALRLMPLTFPLTFPSSLVRSRIVQGEAAARRPGTKRHCAEVSQILIQTEGLTGKKAVKFAPSVIQQVNSGMSTFSSGAALNI